MKSTFTDPRKRQETQKTLVSSARQPRPLRDGVGGSGRSYGGGVSFPDSARGAESAVGPGFAGFHTPEALIALAMLSLNGLWYTQLRLPTVGRA